jgi:hypothetical protein
MHTSFASCLSTFVHMGSYGPAIFTSLQGRRNVNVACGRDACGDMLLDRLAASGAHKVESCDLEAAVLLSRRFAQCARLMLTFVDASFAAGIVSRNGATYMTIQWVSSTTGACTFALPQSAVTAYAANAREWRLTCEQPLAAKSTHGSLLGGYRTVLP